MLGLLPFVAAAPDADRVTSLPGAPTLPSVQFSGFLDGGGGTKLHYWFVTCSADEDWLSKPVVQWFNGGPGSSSVLGMLQEQGPLLIAREGGLHVNPWAWSTAANFLIFESPAGVGYSYCDATKHHKPCVNTDNSTADAAHHALLDFFGTKFPELQRNPFYITGESYAGVYVPMLARRVLDANDRGVQPRINLRSVAVGDPCTDNDSQLDSMDTLWCATTGLPALDCGTPTHVLSSAQPPRPCLSHVCPRLTAALGRYSHKYGLVDSDDFELLWNKCGMRFPSLIALGGFTAGEKQRSFSMRQRRQHQQTASASQARRELRQAWSAAEAEAAAAAAASYRPAHGWLPTESQRPRAAKRPTAAEAAAAKAEERAAASARVVEMAMDAKAAATADATASTTSAAAGAAAAAGEDAAVELALSCRAAERRFLLDSSRGLSQTWPLAFLNDYALFDPPELSIDDRTAAFMNSEEVARGACQVVPRHRATALNATPRRPRSPTLSRPSPPLLCPSSSLLVDGLACATVRPHTRRPMQLSARPHTRRDRSAPRRPSAKDHLGRMAYLRPEDRLPTQRHLRMARASARLDVPVAVRGVQSARASRCAVDGRLPSRPGEAAARAVRRPSFRPFTLARTRGWSFTPRSAHAYTRACPLSSLHACVHAGCSSSTEMPTHASRTRGRAAP